MHSCVQAAGLSILIYNGEADACVPITDNQVIITSHLAVPYSSAIARTSLSLPDPVVDDVHELHCEAGLDCVGGQVSAKPEARFCSPDV